MNTNSSTSGADLERELTSLIQFVMAREPIARGAVQLELKRRKLDRWSTSQRSKTLLRQAKDFRERGRFKHLRAIALIGLTHLGETFLSPLERTGAFIVQDQFRRNRAEDFLAKLYAEVSRTSGDWGRCPNPS